MFDKTYQLTVRKGPKSGHTFELHLPIVNIGRDPMSDINLNDPEVSRQHARLIQTETGYQLQDLNSTNGTYVNGKRLISETVDLTSGQEIMMGSGVVLTYQVIAIPDPALETVMDDPPQPEETQFEDELDNPETVESHFVLPETADPTPAPLPVKHPTAEIRPQPPNPSRRPVSPPPPPREQPTSAFQTEPPPASQRRNVTLAITISLLLLCGCCAFLVFMYYWGGDWILQQLGLLQ